MISVVILVMALIALYFGVKVLENRAKKRITVRLTPELEYEWGNGNDLSELSPDFAEILTTTTMAKLEADWDRAHPSIEDRLKARIKELEEQVRSDGKKIDALTHNNDINTRYHYRNASPGTIINLPNDLTEQQVQEFVKKWTLQAAKKVKNPGSVLHIPEMKVQTQAPIEARIVAESYSSVPDDPYHLLDKKKNAQRMKELQQRYESDFWESAKVHTLAMNKGGIITREPKSIYLEDFNYDYDEEDW
jgi:hypothetical protein